MMHQDDTILYLSRKEVEQACQQVDSVAVIREVFAMHASGQTILPDEAYLGWTTAGGERVRSLNMPSYVGGSVGIAGTKIINSNPHNPMRSLPRASGLTLLYDTTTTRVTCVMEGAYLSSLRTASVTALATDICKGDTITCIAVIGAGVLAQAHIELMVRRIPQVQQIRIFDLSAERVEALQQQIAPLLEAHGVALQVAANPEEAIRPAQLIIPATTTTSGYIQYEWLQPGAILVNISLDDALPEVVFKADKVIVDDWSLVKNDPHRLLGRMYRAGQIIGPDDACDVCSTSEPMSTATSAPRRRIDAQLGEVVLGTKAGRDATSDIILVNPFGLSIEDIALASQVYRIARDLRIGVALER